MRSLTGIQPVRNGRSITREREMEAGPSGLTVGRNVPQRVQCERIPATLEKAVFEVPSTDEALVDRADDP
jgi:hypothetical protein